MAKPLPAQDEGRDGADDAARQEEGSKAPPASARSGTTVPSMPVLAALVGAVAAAAFATSIGGELVWDDPVVVGVAARLASPLAAFSTDLFAIGDAAARGAGASYFRPFVTLSFWLEARLPARPEIAHHVANVAWHAAAAALVALAIERWCRSFARDPAAPASAESSTGAGFLRAASALAALAWATMPLKAENVAWISGRGDAMGLALLLAGLVIGARWERAAARAAACVAATAAALLCKEALVVAPSIVAVDVLARRRAEGGSRGWLSALRSPEVLASGATGAAYLALRAVLFGIRGGGHAMFAALPATDRAALALESFGHAIAALAVPVRPLLLRGPIGFAGPHSLRLEPAMAAIGGLAALGLAALAWRARLARGPVLLLAVGLLPVVNLVPSGLESRMSDRFLYVPSLGVALGLSLSLARAPERARRAALAGAALVTAGLAAVAAWRSTHFRSSDALWSWELEHGSGATTVIINAGNAAVRAGRYEEARDLRLFAASRYQQLGFAEGFPYVMEAMRLHALAFGEADAAFFRGYLKALSALLEGRPEPVEVPMPGGGAVVVQAKSDEAVAYVAARREDVERRLAVAMARVGVDAGRDMADVAARRCPGCRDVVLDAARAHLARLDAARVRDVLAPLPPDDAEAAALRESARLVEALVARARTERGVASALATARAYVVGEAYRPACQAAAKAFADNLPRADKHLVGLACLLGGGSEWPAMKASLGADGAKLERELVAWRTDRKKREALVRSAIAP